MTEHTEEQKYYETTTSIKDQHGLSQWSITKTVPVTSEIKQGAFRIQLGVKQSSVEDMQTKYRR